MSRYLWIQTRDGSPTLWNNELGESFRSVKGAFTESWAAFVEPALAWVAREKPGQAVTVGEFGLGPGTNWVLWNLAFARLHPELPRPYFAIEKDSTSFDMGVAEWKARSADLASFLSTKGAALDVSGVERLLGSFERPRIFASLEAARGQRADVWFHDPFGFDVNPEGYTPESFALCRELWRERGWGGSYACRRQLRETLEGMPGVEPKVVPTGGEGLKRERLEFTWKPQ